MSDPAPPLPDPARPDSAESDSETAGREFQCPTCGGRLQFDAARQCLVCEYCSATLAAGGTGSAVLEHRLSEGRAEEHQRGYGTPVRTLVCEQCGARVSYGEHTTASVCDFCGSPRVLEQSASRKPIRPESVVPFQIDRAAASARFAAWLGSLWFRRSDLKKRAQVSQMTGMYVPYWTFDANVASSWAADAGYYYYTTETYTDRDAQGNTVQRERQVQHVRWQPASGSRSDVYDDLLECGSKGLSRELTQKLEPFDTARLVAYDPSFLAGWRAEEYSVDLDQAWASARSRIEKQQYDRCSGDVPGDTQRNLRVDSRISDETFKHVLLPIWISVYRYGDEAYQFLVNGQTGEVTGRAPWSVIKIAAFSLLIAVLLAVLAFWFSQN